MEAKEKIEVVEAILKAKISDESKLEAIEDIADKHLQTATTLPILSRERVSKPLSPFESRGGFVHADKVTI
ncbi:MAG: hypothetical protein ABF624_00200 [Liquorilactobacillus ghanensis]|uniref:hypothetical protein n=1 Tax=Liquorilactobacillus ghanensis TaxID=399370 RepID=UPI0039EA3C04